MATNKRPLPVNMQEAEHVVDPPTLDPSQLPRLDPTAMTIEGPNTNKQIRFTKTMQSITAGGAHYTPTAGTILVVPQPVADSLIAQRVAEEI